MDEKPEECVSVNLKKLTTFAVLFISGGAIFFLTLCLLFGLTLANQKMQLNELHALVFSQGQGINNISALLDKQQGIFNKLTNIGENAKKEASKANNAVYAAQTAVKNTSRDKTVVKIIKIPGAVQIPVQTKSVVLKVRQHSSVPVPVPVFKYMVTPKSAPTPAPCNRIHALFSKC